MNWWNEVVGWAGMLQLLGLMLGLSALMTAMWFLGKWEGQMEERERTARWMRRRMDLERKERR